jgi:hypothetical protein
MFPRESGFVHGNMLGLREKSSWILCSMVRASVPRAEQPDLRTDSESIFCQRAVWANSVVPEEAQTVPASADQTNAARLKTVD